MKNTEIVAVIALLISAVGLIINIAINYKSIRISFKDLLDWQRQRVENRRAAEAAERFERIEYIQKYGYRPTILLKLRLPLLLFFAALSSIVGFIDFSILYKYDDPLLSITRIVTILNSLFCLLVVFTYINKRLSPTEKFVLRTISSSAIFLILWGFTVVQTILLVLVPPLYAGFVATAIVFVPYEYAIYRYTKVAKKAISLE